MTPSILAVIGSPYQALGLFEYVREHGITKGTVFLPMQEEDPSMLRPTMNVLMHLRGFTFHLRKSTGFRKPGPSTGPVAEEMVAIARNERTVDTVVIGDYRDTSGWRVASLLGRTGSDVVVLDDGASTLAIDRSQGGFEPLEWTEAAERDGFMPQPDVTFFTSMAESLRSAPGDTVLANEWTWLKSRYRDLRRSSSLVLVVGQGFARVRLMDAPLALEVARELIDTARELHPGCRPLYVAHRGEPVDKLAAISETCDVVRFDVPLELVPVETRLLPAGIVGHYSTALTSLAELAPADLPVHAKRLRTDQLLIRQDYVAEVYVRLASDYAGRITVID
ncbi:hypothetical protein [Nocardioides sp. Soil796]|uniref:hypothetical protein n=1 Tax=Nocardioides sp. Soil796 TaxID=1736412 RepID=UPI00070B1615|nr:hypothetical protein [Nocardioides sp. Soil796]KRF14948.1 hypothetical protein ASH02_11865 [Nocardioides sp. Soil796]